MSDEDLLSNCGKELAKMCVTGGASFKMSIPPNVLDTDIMFTELIRRYKELLHYKATMVDLRATDRPDLVHDPSNVMFRIK